MNLNSISFSSGHARLIRPRPPVPVRHAIGLGNFDVLSWMGVSYHLVKMLSLPPSLSLSVWTLTRVEQIVTAAHRDL